MRFSLRLPRNDSLGRRNKMPDASQQDKMDFGDFLKSQARTMDESELDQERVKIEKAQEKLLAKRAVFDATMAIQALQLLQKDGEKLLTQAEDLEIKTEDNQAEAVNIVGKIGKLIKKVDARAKEETEPYREYTAKVNAPRKKIIDALTEAKRILNSKLGQFSAKLRLEREKQKKKMEKASKKLQAELNKDAEKSGVSAPTVAPVDLPKERAKVRGSSATGYVKKTLKFEIVDAGKIPQRYWVINEALIRKDVNAGVKEIPGVRIWEDEQFVTRAG